MFRVSRYCSTECIGIFSSCVAAASSAEAAESSAWNAEITGGGTAGSGFGVITDSWGFEPQTGFSKEAALRPHHDAMSDVRVLTPHTERRQIEHVQELDESRKLRPVLTRGHTNRD